MGSQSPSQRTVAQLRTARHFVASTEFCNTVTEPEPGAALYKRALKEVGSHLNFMNSAIDSHAPNKENHLPCGKAC